MKISEIKALVNNESDKWMYDAGFWIEQVECLIEKVDRLTAALSIIADDETDYPRQLAKDAIGGIDG